MSRKVGLRLLVTVITAGVASAATYQGRSLAEALLLLQKQGLTIVFTNQLVRSGMKVVREPAARKSFAVMKCFKLE